MKFGVVVFPGSNCDHDAFYAIGNVLQKPVEFIWHQSENLANCDAIILPGGFSYGDYLRTGAIARFAPVMDAVTEFAEPVVTEGTGPTVVKVWSAPRPVPTVLVATRRKW